MLRALGWLVAILVCIAGGWWLYNHTGSRAVSTSGDVFPRDTSADSPEERVGSDSPTAASSTPVPATSASPAVTGAPQPAPTPQPTVQPTPPTKPTAGLPLSDTLPRDPPAGMAFGGKGKYQWYRQGDITWRIDTVSGTACIDFATMEQWARPIVYTHGCARS